MYQLPEIKLLAGSHDDTGVTGQGCFMNVIAYLNGESQITDQSECVCFVIRPIAIWLNDYCDNNQRQRLLPFILRAIGSRTDDKDELSRRTQLIIEFAYKQKDLAAEYANKYANTHADKCAAVYADKCAEYAATYADKCANKCAECAKKYAEKCAEYTTDYARCAEYATESISTYAATYAKYAEMNAKYAEIKERIIQAGIDFLDATLPPLSEVHERTIIRAEHLRKLVISHTEEPPRKGNK